MNKILFPVAAAAILLLTTSCGEDTKGTSFEVTDANHDESVNPAHIRGYHMEEPDMLGAPKNLTQYYPFSTKTLPTETRQTLEGGNIAVQMVTVYYSASRSLRDLAEEYNPSGEVGNTSNSPSDTGGGSGDDGTEGGNTAPGDGTGNDNPSDTSGTASGNNQN
ncbi:hypothetical protein [Pontibacter flavimaris]|uniref:Uncharacterized protein n=1 Tax=Pontibacter flavimaris TaxID=1797110 RepID=A0A1Q5PIG2_9BACT|nr:hypothetical protein [Pontibacter flavimaris]OKL42010.1 hypothetical protein A3841_08380 [Pontibacter flavimaris]